MLVIRKMTLGSTGTPCLGPSICPRSGYIKVIDKKLIIILGTSPLHKAALHGHYQTSKMLLSSGCSRDARTKVEKTALHLAASGGHSSIIELLLNANAEVDPKDMVCSLFCVVCSKF